MKKLDTLKSIQLIIYIIIAGVCFYLIVIHSNVYHLIADSKELQLVCLLLWGTLFIAFLFIFIDFSMYARQKKDFKALDYAVHSDPLAKIANRSGCDEVIEKYANKELPTNMCVIMLFLTSLNDINKTQSRTEGNKQIRSFSIILKLASVNMCFVGRNGGNVFMAIFEDTTKENIDLFLDRVETKVIEHNKDHQNLAMHYQYGYAYHVEDAKEVGDLISIANQKGREADRHPIDMGAGE